VAEALNQLLKPIREHFEKDARARELYEFVKSPGDHAIKL